MKLSKRSLIFAGALALLAVVIAVASVTAGAPQPTLYAVADTQEGVVNPNELADWIVEGKRDFVVVDMRPADHFDAGNIRGSHNCHGCHTDAAAGQDELAKMPVLSLGRKMVFVTETGDEEINIPRALSQNTRLYRLQGGYAGWQSEVLAAEKPAAGDDREAIEQKARHNAVRDFFLGKISTGVSVAPTPTVVPARRRPHLPLGGGSEGC